MNQVCGCLSTSASTSVLAGDTLLMTVESKTDIELVMLRTLAQISLVNVLAGVCDLV